jgi:hypothetical protein
MNALGVVEMEEAILLLKGDENGEPLALMQNC